MKVKKVLEMNLQETLEIMNLEVQEVQEIAIAQEVLEKVVN